MSPELVVEKLTAITNSVLDSPEHRDDFEALFSRLNLNRESVTRRLVDYTLKVDSLTNNDYHELEMMAVLHIHNLVKGSYHQTRQKAVSQYLNVLKPRRVVEIGYGAPGSYIFEILNKSEEVSIDLLDRSSSASVFAGAVCELYAPTDLKRVLFKSFDMDDMQFAGDYDTYIFMDSIEHTNLPTDFLKTHVVQSNLNANFILSLPICKIDSLKHAHNIEWLTEDDAESWLESCGLQVIDKVVAKPNPEIDLFAENIEGGYYNVIYLTKQITQEKIYSQYDALTNTYPQREAVFARIWPEDRLMLDKITAELNGNKVLDVGCGVGNYAKQLFDRGIDVYGIDSSLKSIEYGRTTHPDIKDRLACDSFEKIPFSNDYFDCVVSRFALHYAIDPNIGLKEVHRVLKTGGEAHIFLAHPFLLHASKKGGMYHQQEVVGLEILNGLKVDEPSHTFVDYLNLEMLKLFDLIDFHEAKETFIEIDINGMKKQIPTFFYVKLRKR